MSFTEKVCFTEIIHDKVYIGNLSAALSKQHCSSIGATHILSVCPDYPSTSECHLTIPVQDSEYEDLLIHLPKACQFIENAVNGGGRVLVHCVMGVSRSTTVVAAYLMKSRGLDAASAIRFIKRGGYYVSLIEKHCILTIIPAILTRRHSTARPQAHPNYGFITQLVTFAACQYAPCPDNPTYRTWKRKQKQNMTAYLNYISDSTTILPDKLLLSSGFPEDPVQAEALIQDLGVTHLLTISPCSIPPTIPTSTTLTRYQHLSVSDSKNGDLLVTLPEACRFVAQAFNEGGMTLVHCSVESRACTVVCASLMELKNMSPKDAFGVLEDALPLFNPTRNFSRQLELFAACGHKPTRGHYLVQDWIRSQSQKPYSYPHRAVPPSSPTTTTATSSTSSLRPPPLTKRSSSSLSSTLSSPGPSTPPSSASSRTSSTSGSGGPGPLSRIYPLTPNEPDQDQRDGSVTRGPPKPRRQGLPPSLSSSKKVEDLFNGVSSDLVMHAMEMLRERYNDPDARETPPFDLTAFGKALAAIQEREERAGRC